MFNGYSDGLIHITSGRSNGRSVSDVLMDGQITITGTDREKKPFQRIVRFADGEVQDNRLRLEGRTVHHIVYGQFEITYTEAGREIVRFKNGGGKRKHGKSARNEKLFGHAGTCHSWYKNGLLVRQTFVYDNRRRAYEYGFNRKACTVKDPEGNVLYEVAGQLDGRMNAYQGGHAVFSKKMEDWFNQGYPFEVKKNGKPFFGGLMQDRQRVGKWYLQGKPFYYERGVAIPKGLFETPPEKLDPLKIIKLKNAQVRMALMAKIGPDRIAKIGKVIHKDGDMRLYDIKGHDVRILRVKCPTTKSFYYLQVPEDSTKCEDARQWTFHVGNELREPIKFAVET